MVFSIISPKNFPIGAFNNNPKIQRQPIREDEEGLKESVSLKGRQFEWQRKT